jgi:hypothetical protein
MRYGAAALAALVLAAGCGGSGGTTFPRFQRAANGICVRYAKAVNALPAARTMSGIATAARRAYSLGARERTELRQLRPPGEAQDGFRVLLARLEQADELLPDVRQAASQGNQKQVRSLVGRGRALTAQANAKAVALGLDDCRRA